MRHDQRSLEATGRRPPALYTDLQTTDWIATPFTTPIPLSPKRTFRVSRWHLQDAAARWRPCRSASGCCVLHSDSARLRFPSGPSARGGGSGSLGIEGLTVNTAPKQSAAGGLGSRGCGHPEIHSSLLHSTMLIKYLPLPELTSAWGGQDAKFRTLPVQGGLPAQTGEGQPRVKSHPAPSRLCKLVRLSLCASVSSAIKWER